MTPYFADTFYYLALLNPRDEAHQRVTEFTRRIDRATVTTAWVLTEVGDAMAAPGQRRAFIALVEAIRVDPDIEIVPPAADLFERGCALFRDRSDKPWSLTDCISFIVMEDRKLREALTGDRHFEQAGFEALFK
ncbi:MAG: hypothetical protein CHACPFDD_02443 [Phycisphaerae bacterium]|nr:hypothetical protein [Phycisphaerae bacterium]